MTTLAFNDVNFHPVAQNDGQIWLTSAELAKALGYSRTDKISNLYSNHKDEFTDKMTLTLKMGVKGFGNGNSEKDVRIFSLRGCHLLAMFAKTKIAKLFRVWVLNILDKEVGQPTIEPLNQKTTKEERTPLRNAVSTLIGKTNLAFDEAYNMVNQYMGVNHIWEIEKADLPKAVAYVHSLTLGSPRESTPANFTEEVKQFWKMVGLHEFNEMSQAVRNLKATMRIAENQIAQVARHQDLIFNALDEPKHDIGGKDKVNEIYQKALSFIVRQNAMMI